MLQSAEVIEVILTDNDKNYPDYYTIRFKFLNRPGNNDEKREAFEHFHKRRSSLL